MSLIPTFCLSLASLLMMNCASAVTANPLPIRSLAKGGFSGIMEPSEKVIKDQEEWNKLWAAHTAGRRTDENRPSIDFTNEMVIAVTMGRQRSGGYSVEIVKAEPSGEKLKIYVARNTPRPGSMSIQALTAPFHMVAVPKSSLQPEFIEEKTVAAKPPSP